MAFVDPVCRMDVNEAEAAATSTFMGHTYYFCAVGNGLQFGVSGFQFAET